MEKIFKLKENGTNVKTEILAGLTTFMTMAYIIALNPNLLTGFDVGSQLWNGVFLATCIASAIAMFVMAFLANKPFALAPGMGLNSFFAIVVANIAGLTGFSYLQSFQAALCIILIEGVVFLILSLLSIREKIVDSIPLGVRMGIAPGIGLMLMNIGLGSNVGIYSADGGPFYVMRDFFGALTPSVIKGSMGDSYPQMVLTVVTIFVGLFAICILAKLGVKGAVLLGMLISCIIYWAGEAIFLGVNPFASLATASFIPPFGDMVATTLFKFDFKSFFSIGWFTIITLVVTFCMIDMFDTIGTFVGTASRAGMMDKDGKMPKMKEALIADAVGTIAGAATGTSTVTTFVESASGVEAGGRTGLTALTTGILFLACMFIAPIAAIIPAAATSAALIYVGVLMLSGLKNVHFDDLTEIVPVALMLISMPISSSIGHGIGLGLISYTVIKVFTGKAKEVSIVTYIISALFLVKFFLVVYKEPTLFKEGHLPVFFFKKRSGRWPERFSLSLPCQKFLLFFSIIFADVAKLLFHTPHRLFRRKDTSPFAQRKDPSVKLRAQSYLGVNFKKSVRLGEYRNIFSEPVHHHSDQLILKAEANHLFLSAKHGKYLSGINGEIQPLKLFVSFPGKIQNLYLGHFIHPVML